MDNPDSVWQWCNAGRKICEGRSPVAETAWVADGFHSKVSKTNGRRRKKASSVRRSQKIRKENALKPRDSCGNLCFPVQSSMMEIEPFNCAADANTNSTKSAISLMPELALSSDTNWDTVSNGPHHDSARRRSYFSITERISVQDQVFCQKFQRKRTELMVWRRGQKKVMEQDSACVDEGNDNSVCQFSLCNGDTSVEISSYGFIPEVAEDVNLQAWIMNGQIGNPGPVGGSESTYSNNGLTWHPNDLNSEAYWRPSDAVKDQKGASEIALEGLHVLADAAIWMLENDQADASPQHTEGMASSQKWIRKAIFFLTGEPYLQKRVIRRARSAYRKKYDRPGAIRTHDMQNLKPAISEPLMADNTVIKLGQIQDFDQAAERPKRVRLQTMPSKYSDSVLHTWKRGSRR